MDNYEKLREILDKHLAGAPPSKKLDGTQIILLKRVIPQFMSLKPPWKKQNPSKLLNWLLR